MGAAGSAQTKIEKKARRTPQDLPRAADGRSNAQGAPPVEPIDLTGEISTTVAIPPTPTQETGREDPKGPGKGQEVGEQRACDQTNPLKVT